MPRAVAYTVQVLGTALVHAAVFGVDHAELEDVVLYGDALLVFLREAGLGKLHRVLEPVVGDAGLAVRQAAPRQLLTLVNVLVTYLLHEKRLR